MLRQLSVVIGLAFAAQLAYAAEAGKIIFVAGAAHIAERPVAEGASVQEGDLLSTGANGFIYVKTIDNGLFILRPNTKARIAAYHVDVKNPANTRIKLELLSGVARSRSGDAVKLARQNFRFNTPVAAIGVRGTDFTVFTDQDTSRVAVISGGIVVSGFVGACRPEGSGPCEGNASRELSAAQRGLLLQIQRGQAPQLMQGGALGPDQMTPPRGDEPIGKNSGVNSSSTVVSAEPSLDAKKSESLNLSALTPVAPPVAGPVAPPVLTPPVVEVVPPPPPVVVTPPVAQLPDSKPVWGRWQPLLEQPAKIDLTAEKATSELLAVNGNFALFRTRGKDYVSAERGTAGFALKDSEAYVYTDTASGRSVAPATLENGQLNVDFGKKKFTTSLDLVSNLKTYKLQAEGVVAANGRLYGDQAYSRFGLMNVQGLLSNDNGGTAAYVFDGRLDSQRTVNGVTYWQK